MTDDKVEILVCMNVGCRSRGAAATLSRLEAGLKERGKGDVKVESIICFAACNVGPNIVIPSKRCWLSGVASSDVDDVIGYIDGQATVTRLQQQNDAELEKMIFDMIDAGLLDRGGTV